VTDQPVFDPGRQMPCFYFGIPNRYMIHTFSSGGIVLKWLRDSLCPEELNLGRRTGWDAYRLMDLEAKEVPPGADGLIVLPHFQGSGPPDSDQKAKGVVYGLALNHTKGHLIRAFMEGVAMTMRHMIEATTRATGAEISEIRSLSGGAKSDLWCQIKADASGLPVRTMKNTADAACLGAAVLAGVAVEIWPSVEAAMDGMAESDQVFQPQPANREVYDRLYSRYKGLMAVLRPFH
jgi:xylulokinase